MVIGPFLVMMFGISWTIGCMALAGLKLNYMTSILPGFLISVCVGDAIHIQALVHKSLDQGRSKKEAIIDAMQHSWDTAVTGASSRGKRTV